MNGVEELMKKLDFDLANVLLDLQTSSVFVLAGHIRDMTVAVQKVDTKKEDVIQSLWKMYGSLMQVAAEVTQSRKQKPPPTTPGGGNKRPRSIANLSPEAMMGITETSCCPALHTIKQQLDRMEGKMNQVDTTLNKKLYSTAVSNNNSGTFSERTRYQKQITMVIKKDVNGVSLTGQTIKQEMMNLNSVQNRVGMQAIYKDKSAILTVRSDAEAEVLRNELKSNDYVIAEKGARMPQLKIIAIGSETVQT